MRQPVRCTWALGSALGTLRESDDSYRSPVAEVPGPWYAAPRFKSSFGGIRRGRYAARPCGTLAHRVGGSLTILISARLPAP